MRWERTIRHPLPGAVRGRVRGAHDQPRRPTSQERPAPPRDGRVMTVALRMTGALIVAPPGTPDDRYARVVFRLADGRELRYRDVRKFGRIGLWERGGVPSAPSGKSRGRPKRVAGARGAVPGRRRLRAPRAGAAGPLLQRGPPGGAAERAIGAAEDPAAGPVASSPGSATSTPTRRSGEHGSTRCGPPTR